MDMGYKDPLSHKGRNIAKERAGLRLLVLPSASRVAYCGIAVKAGTRQETPQQYGLAHFCEHLAFKGTQRRSATKIINAIEGLGGELNAFTNKEDTVFYCIIEQQHLRRALDVLQDIVFCSQHPEAEVEKEREVVCDEIESYEDTPAELIFDEFENILFDGHPLGHNILGTAEQLRTYTHADTLRFTRQWYRPENCVLFMTTPRPSTPGSSPFGLPHATEDTPERGGEGRLARSEKSSAGLSEPLPSEVGGLFVRHRDTHQAHVMMGTRAFAASDPRRWALYLLNNILGGPAMNSRLNLALRERNGLVYTVDSTMTCYSDTGLWAVYFGCDPHDVDRCRRLVYRQLERLMLQPLSDRQLAAAKRQLQGQLAIASENREQFVIDSARTFLHTGRERSLADVMGYIDRLTAADLLSTAQLLFSPGRLTTLIYK